MKLTVEYDTKKIPLDRRKSLIDDVETVGWATQDMSSEEEGIVDILEDEMGFYTGFKRGARRIFKEGNAVTSKEFIEIVRQRFGFPERVAHRVYNLFFNAKYVNSAFFGAAKRTGMLGASTVDKLAPPPQE